MPIYLTILDLQGKPTMDGDLPIVIVGGLYEGCPFINKREVSLNRTNYSIYSIDIEALRIANNFFFDFEPMGDYIDLTKVGLYNKRKIPSSNSFLSLGNNLWSANQKTSDGEVYISLSSVYSTTKPSKALPIFNSKLLFPTNNAKQGGLFTNSLGLLCYKNGYEVAGSQYSKVPPNFYIMQNQGGKKMNNDFGLNYGGDLFTYDNGTLRNVTGECMSANSENSLSWDKCTNSGNNLWFMEKNNFKNGGNNQCLVPTLDKVTLGECPKSSPWVTQGSNPFGDYQIYPPTTIYAYKDSPYYVIKDQKGRQLANIAKKELPPQSSGESREGVTFTDPKCKDTPQPHSFYERKKLCENFSNLTESKKKSQKRVLLGIGALVTMLGAVYLSDCQDLSL